MYRALKLMVMVVGFSAYLGQATAMTESTLVNTDNRIKTLVYAKDNVVPITAVPFFNTQIIFGEDESVVDMESGDPGAWTTNINKYLQNVLNIKPTIVGSHTDLDVTTIDQTGHRRYYRFYLTSAPSAGDVGEKPLYAVRFTYPDKEKANEQAKQSAALQSQQDQRVISDALRNPQLFNWDYSLHGAHSIAPLRVFDDGKFMYLLFQSNQALPAIFAVDNAAGHESVVNYRRVGYYLVVEQVAPQFTLRKGNYAVTSLFNNKLIAPMRRDG